MTEASREPSGREPSGREPSDYEPSDYEPSGDEPLGDESLGDEPLGDEPSGHEPSGREPSGHGHIVNAMPMHRSTTDISSEQSLVEALRRRDRDAVGILYDRYSAMLFSLVFRIVRREDVAEDVLQETFIKVWRRFDSYDATKGALSTWLMSVARSVAIDKIRSKGFRNALENQSLDESVSRLVDRQESTTIAADAIGVEPLLRRLRPEQQRIIELIYYQGFTHEETARELAMPLGTVKTRLRAAIMQLRRDVVETGRAG